MKRQTKSILTAAVICLVLVGVAGGLMRSDPNPSGDSEPAPETYLVNRPASEVETVTVVNEAGSYTVQKRPDGSYGVHDIPDAVVMMEYVDMLLDECSAISYAEVIDEKPGDLAQYGLDRPKASVEIRYSDDTGSKLLIGEMEPISGNCYGMEEGDPAVYLFEARRCIRFLMPVERFIDFIIIEPNESTDILGSLGDMTFGGSMLEQPVVLKRVSAESGEELLRQAVSFGAVTHMMTEPQLHEANQTELTKIGDSLLGLISEGVVAYNCSEEVLAEYGFDDPLLTIGFDYRNGAGREPQYILLKLSRLEDGTDIVTLDGEGIIYRIADVEFTGITYETLVSRWFLTPLLTDVAELEIQMQQESYRFETEGSGAKDLSVTLNGEDVDAAQYRKFYNLAVSAAADEAIAGPEPNLTGEPVMSIRFRYKDQKKPDDVMEFYEGQSRRLYVQVNGRCEFTMRNQYKLIVEDALKALKESRDFQVNW